ncbi:DUF3397 family protein [Gracilibacillus sp. S3-1-1]|uniref:DUF3397 family protein n=1 Tax=Gracilibacillus pellucidus TaxID=3095368 RepID=A0ACC6M1U5_9BACI|nr:DUF3397 family protein [Gracilibacillus sp. S3-1-1]MDX8044919.1 DUF3397 family protein [Gracilibacillus sp. S3-1-1]
MIEGFYYLLGAMITLPFLITFLVYKLSCKVVGEKRFSFHLAIDLTTILYIGSVIAMIYTLFSINPISYIILLLLFLLIACVFIHWRAYTDIVFTHVWKRFWKATFLLFFTLHILILLVGIVYNITIVL